METISVIVPTYNSQSYVLETLASIQNQTHRQLEIIVVDDGSSDDTVALIREQQILDRRIVVYPLKNEGAPGHCRNHGYAMSTANYILFFDSDDIMHPTMLEELYQTMRREEVDLVVCNTNYLDMDTKEPLTTKMEWFFAKEDFVIADLFQIGPFPCNKLYRKAFLTRTQVSYLHGVFNQDLGYFLSNLCYLPSFAIIRHPLMDYMVRKGSITTSAKTRKRHIDIIVVFDQVFETWQQTGGNPELTYPILRMFIRSMIFKASFFDLLEETAYLDRIRINLNKHCPHWYRRAEFKDEFTWKKRLYNRLILQLRCYALVGHYKRWKGSAKKI